jgi:hypothetical protein
VARFYSDEKISQQVVAELRRLGHDVLTSLEAGNANSSVSDSDVLAFAATKDRILLSHNRLHFLRLHRHWTQGHSGTRVWRNPLVGSPRRTSTASSPSEMPEH